MLLESDVLVSMALSGLLLLGLFALIGVMCLEAGLVRAKNTNDILIKNIALLGTVSLLFILLRTHFELTGWTAFVPSIAAIKTTIAASTFFTHILFRVILLVFGLSIIIGATAERLRFWPFLMFTVLTLILIYPLEAFWVWGDGFLHKWHFIDQGGASLIHLNGAIAALTALFILGARRGKYDDGESLPLPGANIPLSTLGIGFIWIGFIALNLLTVIEANAGMTSLQVFNVVTNTLLAGSAGLLVVGLFSRIVFGPMDLTLIFNGILAGLVSMSASPAAFSNVHVIVTAGIAAMLTMLGLYILDKWKIDDPVGITMSFLMGSLTGLLAAAFCCDNILYQLGLQVIGIISIALYSSVANYLLWWGVRIVMGLRIKPEDEYKGLDVIGCGMVAYPEFTASNWEK